MRTSDNFRELARRPESEHPETMPGLKGWIQKIASMYETDRRRRVRLSADFLANLSGSFGECTVVGIDASRDGARVRADNPFAIGTLVVMRIPACGLVGFAHVRHCLPCNGGYTLGLEFREPLSREREELGTWNQHTISGGAVWNT